MLLKKSSCVFLHASVFVTASFITACVCYHCVGMYPAYICIFLHESEDVYVYNKKPR